MLSLVFRDADGIEQAYCRDIYQLSWSFTEKGGPFALMAAVPIDIIAPKVNLIDSVSLYDGLDELWIGRVRERPMVAANKQAAVVTAEGYINHLGDDSLTPAYLDARLDRWDDPERYPAGANVNGSLFAVDKLNRLMVGVRKGQAYAAGDTAGLCYYSPCGTIKRFVAPYDVNCTTSHRRAELYAYNGSWTLIWQHTTTGAATGTIDISTTSTPSGDLKAAMPANTTELLWRMYAVDAVTHTGNDNAEYVKLTAAKVYLQTLADYKTTTVLKDVLADFCPALSTDVSQITAGTYTLPEFYSETKQTPLQVLQELNTYEGYDYGVYDRDASGVPRLTFGPHDFTAIDYFAPMRTARPDLSGESLDRQFNAVDVEYQDADTGRTLTETRTHAHALLDAWGITRKPPTLSVQSTSSATADQGGDTLLDDKARAQGKGGYVIRGYVRDRYGRKIPAHQIRTPANIFIPDLRPSPSTLDDLTSANVLNGVNVFRVVQADLKPFEATLQLDNEGDRLDFVLKRVRSGHRPLPGQWRSR